MVQWQRPPEDQWNGLVGGYIVRYAHYYGYQNACLYSRYRLANYPGIPWLIKNVTDSRVSNTPIEDLLTWQEYEIQVRGK
jgi:hypothetical protein